MEKATPPSAKQMYDLSTSANDCLDEWIIQASNSIKSRASNGLFHCIASCPADLSERFFRVFRDAGYIIPESSKYPDKSNIKFSIYWTVPGADSELKQDMPVETAFIKTESVYGQGTPIETTFIKTESVYGSEPPKDPVVTTSFVRFIPPKVHENNPRVIDFTLDEKRFADGVPVFLKILDHLQTSEKDRKILFSCLKNDLSHSMGLVCDSMIESDFHRNQEVNLKLGICFEDIYSFTFWALGYIEEKARVYSLNISGLTPDFEISEYVAGLMKKEFSASFGVDVNEDSNSSCKRVGLTLFYSSLA